MHNTLFRLALLALTTICPLLLAEIGPQAAIPLEEKDNGSPRLEIRNYRFQAHRGFERLVLEFTRKDSNPKMQPSVKTSAASNGEVDIIIDRAMLMGAIPESLINDSYANKSRILGNLSVNADNPGAGFGLRASLKNPRAKIKAFWLATPPRLVIDATTGKEVASHEGGHHESKLDVVHKRPEAPAFDKFICFPAAARVGMNVVFQAKQNKEEELKNVHVNLQGTSTVEEAPPAADAIVCYPRAAQVIAQLGFVVPKEETQQQAEAAPIAPGNHPMPAPAAAATSNEDSDMTLDPSGASPRMPGSTTATPPKQPAPLIPAPPVASEHAPEASQKAPTTPASLLPPLK